VADGEGFSSAWRQFASGGPVRRLLAAVGLGAAGFSMQDVLLEPYGGQILGLGVGATTMLTAIWALGTLAGFLLAARGLARGGEPYRLSGYGAAIGAMAFGLVMLSAPMQSDLIFRVGVFGIGFGGGLFSVGTLTAAMALARDGYAGLAIGAWGAVQATCAGVGVALAGALRDGVAASARAQTFGEAATSPAIGYLSVYGLEIILLFAAIAAIGPLARYPAPDSKTESRARSPRFGLSEFPT
jgi:BCD family chlorophyll transporter-like MFS transporter